MEKKLYQQFIIIFELTITGYLCRKRGIIDDGMNRGMNKFIIMIAYPCLILDRMGNLGMPKGAFQSFGITVLISLVMFFVIGGYAYLYMKARKYSAEDAPVAEFAVFAPNNGFMGFPIAFMFLKDLGLLYMIACNLSLNIIFFTYGIKLMKRGKDLPKKNLWSKVLEVGVLLVNPKISAAVIGLILCYFEIRLPEALNTYLSLVGGIATPMAMIFIGSTLATCKIKDCMKDRMVLEVSVNKLIMAPIITAAIIWFMPIDPLVKAVLILGNAIPVATTVPIFSEQFDRNKEMASEVLFVTTLFSTVTIPIAVWLLSKFVLG